MIRRMQKEEIDQVAAIWLDTNRKAHDFIPASYWEGNFEAVRSMLLQAELYIWEEKMEIAGFVGLRGIYRRHFCERRPAVRGDWKAAAGFCEGEKRTSVASCI